MSEAHTDQQSVATVYIDVPTDRVWHELTKTDSVQRPLYNTTLTGEFAPGSRVTLTHSGWTDAHHTAAKTEKSWNEILGLLKADLETGSLPIKTRLTYRIMSLFSFALPKRTTAAHADQQGW